MAQIPIYDNRRERVGDMEERMVCAQVVTEVKKAVVGKDEVVVKLLLAILARGHVLLEAMEEGQVTVDGVSHPIPQPFLVIATQNPAGAAGRRRDRRRPGAHPHPHAYPHPNAHPRRRDAHPRSRPDPRRGTGGDRDGGGGRRARPERAPVARRRPAPLEAAPLPLGLRPPVRWKSDLIKKTKTEI